MRILAAYRVLCATSGLISDALPAVACGMVNTPGGTQNSHPTSLPRPSPNQTTTALRRHKYRAAMTVTPKNTKTKDTPSYQYSGLLISCAVYISPTRGGVSQRPSPGESRSVRKPKGERSVIAPPPPPAVPPRAE